MGTERIDLQVFLSELLEQLGPAIPDRVVFTCQLIETPPVHVDPAQLRGVLASLVATACAAGDEVRLRTGTVAGKSGPHALVEIGRPDAGTRIIVPASDLPAGDPAGCRFGDVYTGGPAPVAQGIERAPPEREVAGSIPARRISHLVAERKPLELAGRACRRRRECSCGAYPRARMLPSAARSRTGATSAASMAATLILASSVARVGRRRAPRSPNCPPGSLSSTPSSGDTAQARAEQEGRGGGQACGHARDDRGALTPREIQNY